MNPSVCLSAAIVTAVSELLVHCFRALEHRQATSYTPASKKFNQYAAPLDPLAGSRAANRPTVLFVPEQPNEWIYLLSFL